MGLRDRIITAVGGSTAAQVAQAVTTTRDETSALVRSTVETEMARMFYAGTVDGSGRTYGGGNTPHASFSTHDLLFSAMSLLMQDVAAIPRKISLGDGSDAISKDPILDFINKRPSPDRYPDGDYVMSLIAGYLLDSGNAWIWVNPTLDSKTRLPVEILILGMQHVFPVINYRNGSLMSWRITWGSERKEVPPDYLTHIKLLPDLNDRYQILGCGPVRAAAARIDGIFARQLYDKAFFEGGAEPSTVLRYDASGDTRLEPKATKVNLDAMVRLFKERHVGVKNMRGVIGLDAGWHMEPFSTDHGNLEMVKMAVQGVQDVARIFKIPPTKLGDYSSVGLSREGIEATDSIYAVQALVPLAKIIASGLSRALEPFLNGREFILDKDEIDALKGRFSDKVTNYGALVTKYVSPRVAAKLVDLGTKDEDLTDDVIVSGIVTTLEDALSTDPVDPNQPTDPNAPVDPNAPPVDPNAPVDDLAPNAPEPVVKASARTFQPKRLGEWRTFVAKWSPLETTCRNRLKRYFRELRTETLKNLDVYMSGSRSVDDDLKRILFDETDADRNLRNWIAPYFERAITIGADDVAQKLGTDTIGLDSPGADNVLRTKRIQVTRINDTLREALRTTLRDGLNAGEALTDLAARVRTTFQDRAENGASRTRTIARTEIASSVNGGKQAEMQAQGVEQQEWMTAGDDHVRDSHAEIDGEVAALDEPFPNGLLYPGDPNGPPEEIIQCRCTTTPLAPSDGN